ncbi:MAG: hypothetical protein KA257_10585 [Opitutaceae bacterium]|nr:hypothetical protein [Opitutaceae bacterium]MBP9912438.1 hypothetical protein [Opitutaceae bacterium]
MHTIIVTAVGLLLLFLFLAFASRRDLATRRFIPVWLGLCLIPIGYGVFGAGYGVIEELGVHAVVFGLPATLA